MLCVDIPIDVANELWNSTFPFASTEVISHQLTSMASTPPLIGTLLTNRYLSVTNLFFSLRLSSTHSYDGYGLNMATKVVGYVIARYFLDSWHDSCI